MIQLLSVLIIHSTPFDEVAQGPAPPKGPTGALSLEGGKTIQVTQIQFSGNKAISTKQLERLVSQYANKMLAEFQIQEIKQRVTHFYKSHGYNDVQVKIPKKRSSGTLTVVIVEGKKTS